MKLEDYFFFLVRGSRALKGGGGKPEENFIFLGGTDGHFIRLIKIPEKKN